MTEPHLERIDWRFLLPLPESHGGTYEHALLIGADGELTALVSASGVARRLSGSVAAAAVGGPAPDLLLIFDGFAERRDAVALLQPGGVVYFESARRRGLHSLVSPARTLGAVARRDGLKLIAGYGVWPSLKQPSVWLPVLVPGILLWYSRTLHSLRTRGERMAARVLDSAGAPTALGWPLVTKSFAAIARKPGGELGAGTDVAQGEAPRSAMVVHGSERVVVFRFGSGAQPHAVQKIPRDSRYNAKNEAEQAVMMRLRTALPPGVASALPEPRGLRTTGDIVVASEEYVAGRPAVFELRPSNPTAGQARDIARGAGQWLAEFHASTATDRNPLAAPRLRAWLGEPAAALARALPGMTAIARLVGAVTDAINRLAGVPVPTVCRHWDFTPWNLIRSPAGLRVLDWEGAAPGAPLCDLVHFLTHWYEVSIGASSTDARRHAFRTLFCSHAKAGSLAGAGHDVVRDYSRRLELDSRWIPPLIGITWLSLAARHFRSPDSVVNDTVPEEPLLRAVADNWVALSSVWAG